MTVPRLTRRVYVVLDASGTEMFRASRKPDALKPYKGHLRRFSKKKQAGLSRELVWPSLRRRGWRCEAMLDEARPNVSAKASAQRKHVRKRKPLPITDAVAA